MVERKSRRPKRGAGPAREVQAVGSSAPIFVHSGFRTGSTWLWSVFRSLPGVIAYYEVFHEILETMTLSDAWRHRPTTWDSGHPDSGPYFTEFTPLLRPGGGLPHFRREMAFESFIPRAGIGGDLSEEERDYLRYLIRSAISLGKTPVLTDTRTLGRLSAIKRDFNGVHLILHRNLFHQWCSFQSLARKGNWYFLESVLNTIKLNRSRDPFLALLDEYVTGSGLADSLRDLSNLQADELYAVFLALQVYVLVRAMPQADLVIHLNQLARGDSGHVAEVEAQVEHLIGRHVNLGTVRESFEVPLQPIADPRAVDRLVRGLVDRALDTFDHGPEARQLSAWLLDESSAEERRFRSHRSAFLKLGADGLRALGGFPSEAGAGNAGELAPQLEAARAEIAALRALQQKLQARSEAADHLQARVDQLEQQLAAQEGELQDLRLRAQVDQGAESIAAGLAAERDALAERCSELEAARAQAEHWAEQAAQGRAEAEAKLGQLEAAAGAAVLQQQVALQEKEALANQFAALAAAHAELAERLSASDRLHQEQAVALEAERTVSVQDLAQRTAELAAAQAAKADAEAAREAERRAAAEARDSQVATDMRLTDLEAPIAESVEAQRNEMDALRGDLAEAGARRAAIEQDKAETEHRLLEAGASIEAIGAEPESLKGQLSESLAREAALAADLTESRTPSE